VLAMGIAGTAVACVMAVSNIESAFKTFNSLIGLTAGALGGLFALGVFTRRANGTGAMIGALVGLGSVMFLYFSGSKVSGLLYAFIGFAVCFVVGYIASLLTGPERGRDLSIHG
jgi:SSS family solute:Na+ symporter